MKIFSFILILLSSLSVAAQNNTQYLGTVDNTIKVRNDLIVDSSLVLPKDTLKSALVGSFSAIGNILYLKTNAGWKKALDSTLSNSLHVAYNPANLTKQVGQSATFGVVASGGKAPYKYQWQKVTTNRTADTLASLVISTTALSDTGNYRVRITDSLGVVVFSQYANLSIISVSSGGGGSTTTGQLSADSVFDGTTKRSFLATERTKLAGIAAGATVNSSDAALRDRSTHTGTQAATTVTEDVTHRFTTDAEKATWNAKQAPLVSGTNIKTINGTSILGSGNLVIAGGGGSTDTTSLSNRINILSARMDSAYTQMLQLADSSGFALKSRIRTDSAILSGTYGGGSGGSGSLAWADITGKPTTLSGYGITDAQPLDADLTQIAAISPANDDFIQRKAGAWVNRTMAQLRTDLGLTKSDVGLGNVDNTSDVNKPVSTAQQTALNLKAPIASPVFTGVPKISTDTVATLANVRTILGAPVTIASANTAGYIPAFKKSNDTIYIKDIAISAGPGISVNIDSTGGKKIGYQITLTGNPYGAVWLDSTGTTCTINTSNGLNQYLSYHPASSGTINLPTTADANGMVVHVSVTSSFPVKFNVTVYESSVASTVAGSNAIAASGGADLVRNPITGNWQLYTVR